MTDDNHYHHVKATERAGDFESMSHFAVALPGDTDLDTALHAFFGEYYGPETRRVDDYRWETFDTAIWIDQIDTITEQEYQTLSAYLTTIRDRDIRLSVTAEDSTGKP